MRSPWFDRRSPRAVIRALAGAIILVVASVGTALAADPGTEPGPEPPPLPEGVTADATVTVRFILPVADGGGPIADAGVTLTVARAGEVLQFLYGVTDPDGGVIFEGVARASDGGDPTLATAYAETALVPPDEGCAIVTGWKGVRADVQVEAATAIEVEADITEGEICVGDGGSGGLPDGVVADATLVVTVLDDQGQPLPYAMVTLLAWTGDETATFWKTGTSTDDQGVVALTDLPRPEDGGPAVTWWVEAYAMEEAAADGCYLVSSWVGIAETTAVAGESTLDVPTTLEQGYGQCSEPGDDAPVLRGTAVGPDGEPLAGSRVDLRMIRADGATWYAFDLVTGDDGSFELRIQPWGTTEAPARIEIEIRGEVTRTEPSETEACDLVFSLIASYGADLVLADGGDAEPVALIAAEGELGLVCDEVPGSETDNGAGGPKTDPQTDTEDLGALATVEFWRAVIILVAAVIATLAVALAPRRRTGVTVRRDDRLD